MEIASKALASLARFLSPATFGNSLDLFVSSNNITLRVEDTSSVCLEALVTEDLDRISLQNAITRLLG
jgi:hypothetical protein